MNDFYELGMKHGTDKVGHHGYHFCYPTYLERFRDLEFSMLEIGYQGGHSCRMWEQYFPKAKIFAIDIGVEGQFDNHTVFKADQSSESDLTQIVERIGSAKFIIDDGSHNPAHQIKTFNMLFENLLEPGGVYIIEDTECNYWREDALLYGYQVGSLNVINYLKDLVDCVNSEFSKKENSLQISSITYSQNCIVITKQTEAEREHFNRAYRYGFNCK